MSLLETTYVADFETNNHEDDCRVWLWDACDINEFQHTYGYDIDSFIDWLVHSNCQRCMFHNLAFDGSFIIDYLEHSDKFEYRTKPSTVPQYNTYDILKTRDGSLYCIRIYMDRGVRYNYGTGKLCCAKRNRIEIWDSYKKIAMPVEEIAKSFNTVFEKGDIDYNMRREVEYVPTEEELDYITRDVAIVAEAIRLMYDMGLDKMTIGGDAMSFFKSKIPLRMRETLFPSELYTNLDMDKFIRRAYKGGFRFLNPEFQNVEVKNGFVLDVNSMYSYHLKDKLLPMGLPIWFDGKYEYDDEYPLYVVEISISGKLKEGYLPCVSSRGTGLYMDNEMLYEFEDLNVVVTNIDLELIRESYDIESIAYFGGYKFRAMQGLFDEYIDYWMSIKEESEGGVRLVSKLMLNNLIGKFGTNPMVSNKKPVLCSDGVVRYETLDEESSSNPVYLPIPVFVNSYARDHEIRTAMRFGKNLIYCDTDSVHALDCKVPEGVVIHESKLGAFKVESKFSRGFYISLKRYVHENEEGEIDVKCSGLPAKCKDQVTFDNFRVGSKYFGKLNSKHVLGGVVLREGYFHMT